MAQASFHCLGLYCVSLSPLTIIISLPPFTFIRSNGGAGWVEDGGLLLVKFIFVEIKKVNFEIFICLFVMEKMVKNWFFNYIFDIRILLQKLEKPAKFQKIGRKPNLTV